MITRKILVLLFFCSFGISKSVFSQTTYDMALGYKRTFSSDWLGFNGSNVLRDSLGWPNPLLVSHLPLLNPMNLRYPAGGPSNWWNWRVGGFVTSPFLPKDYQIADPNENTLENFKKSLDATGANAVLAINMVSSTLQEQIAMLKHADSIGIRISLVELGSEFYLDGDEEAEVDSSYIVSLFPTAQDYALVASKWADTIHHYFPNAKVAAQGAFNRNNASRRITWDENLFPTLHGEDAITYHTYMSADSYDEDSAISSTFSASDVPTLLGRPFKMWEILTTEDFPLIPPGKDIWITEYNLRDHSKPVHGSWAHGLFLATQTMQYLNDSRITHLTCHNMMGSAVSGAFFNTTKGYEFGKDGNFLAPPNPPASTQYWGLSAGGRVLQQLGLAVKGAHFVSPVEFKFIPSITSFDGLDTLVYPSVYGWAFVGDNSTQVIAVNLSATDVKIKTTFIFPSGGTYTQYSADPMLFVAKENDIAHTDISTLPSSLILKAYSITRLSGSTVPPAPVAVNIVATGATSFCLGDSVKLDAGAGFVEYRWSTGDSSRTIWAKSDADYWVHARKITNGYWAGDTMHVTVHQPPAIPLVNNIPSYSFCHGDSAVLTVKFPDPSFTYSWSNGKTGTSAAIKAAGAYTVSATNSFGCHSSSAPVTFTEFVLPQPLITASGALSFCFDQSVTLDAGAGYKSYTWSNGSVGQTHSFTTAGSYSVIVKDNNNCLGTSPPVAVTTYTPADPSLSVNGGPATFCADLPVYLATISGYSYQWQKSNLNISGATLQNYFPAATASYRVVITDSHGCTKRSDPTDITVNALPAPNITVTGGTSLCSGQSTNLAANNVYSAYLWSTGATTASISVSAGGNYTLKVTNDKGCAGSSALKTITVNLLPVPAITASGSTDICSGASATLAVTQTYSNYSWSNGMTGQSKSFSASGNYNCTVTDINGCKGVSNSIAVTSHTAPIPTVNSSTGATTFCSASGVYLNTQTANQYQWSKGGTDLAGGTNQNYTPTELGNYKVRISDSWGCTATSLSFNITVNASPTPGILVTGKTTLCNGQTATLASSSYYPSYLWSTGATTSSISVSAANSYTLTVTGGNGCSAVATPVSIFNSVQNVNIDAAGAVQLCTGGNVVLSASAPFNGYHWSNGAITQSITASLSGTYSCTVTDAGGCTGVSNPIAVTVGNIAVPGITVTGGTNLCGGQSAVLSSNETYASYLWSTGATTSSITVSAAGSYTLSVTNSGGCTNVSNAVAITVASAPAPAIIVTGGTNLCEGQSTLLSSSGTFTSYLWSTGATTSSIVVSAAGTYKLTVTNSSGCTGVSSSVAVTIASQPVSAIDVTGGTNLCEGQSTVLSSNGAFTSYLWSNGAITSSINVSDAASYMLTVTNSSGCTGVSNAVAVTVASAPAPVITVTGGTNLCGGESTLLSSGGAFASYLWSTGATTSSIAVSSSGTYKLTVTNTGGCTGVSGSVAVAVASAPAPVITVNGGTNLCIGQSTTLSSNETFTSYLWSTGATTSSIIVSAADTYTLTVTNSSGCTGASNPVAVTLGSSLTPGIVVSGSPDLCEGQTTTLSTDGSYSSYQWSTGDTTSSIIASTAGTYAVTVTNSGGCTGVSNSVAVTVASAPTAGIIVTGSINLCAGQSSVLSSSETFTSYLWSTGATTSSIAVSVGGAYTLTVTNSNGCTGITNPQNIISNPLPEPIITASGAIEFCSGSNVSLSSDTYSGYEWSNSQITQLVSINTTGIYTCTVTDANGCTGVSNPIAVNVHTLSAPIVNTSNGATTFCSNTGVYLTTPVTGYSYQWFKDSNTQPGAENQNYTPNDSGNYQVQIMDGIGCSSMSSVLLIAVNTPTVPTITASGPIAFCAGGSVNLTASTASDYSWSGGMMTQEVTIDTSGNYTVMTTDVNGCTSISSPVTIIMYPSLNAIVTAVGSTTYCVGSPENYLSANSDASYSYQWMMGVAPQSGATNQTFQPTVSGTYKVTVTNTEGCSASSTNGVSVTANMIPTVIISTPGSLNTCDSAIIVMSAVASDSIDITYQWMNNGTSIAGATMSAYNANAAGIYTCIATSNQLCPATSNSLVITSDCLADGLQSTVQGVKSSMMLYPNPAFNNVHINGQFASHAEGEAMLEIRNILGSILYFEKLDLTGGKFATSILLDQHWVIGNYFVRVTFNEEVMLQQLLIIDSNK